MYGRGVYPMLSRAEIQAVHNDGAEQYVDGIAYVGDSHTKMYRPQMHGFTSVPPIGSTAMLLAFGGERSRGLILGGEMPSLRPMNDPAGTTKLYDDQGNIIFVGGKTGIAHNAKTGDYTITTQKGKVNVTAEGTFGVVSNGGKIYLGDLNGSNCYAVMTVSGPSSQVFAKL